MNAHYVGMAECFVKNWEQNWLLHNHENEGIRAKPDDMKGLSSSRVD